MIIFIDMDEVMADTYLRHLELYNDEFDGQLSLADCSGSELYQVVPEAHAHSVRNHVRRKGFFRSLKPVAGSQAVIEELNKHHSVYVASAAMEFPNSLVEKSDWLDEHFPFIDWKQRILCGDKSILRGDVLIDDRAYNLEGFDGRPLLFRSPHNHREQRFEAVVSWEDVASLLL